MGRAETLDIGYRLMVTDLDGTIVGPDLTVSPLVRDALRRLRTAGTRIILNTGRMVSSALPYALEVDADGTLITYHGALIRDTASGRDLLHRPVPLELARDLIDMLEPEGWDVHAYLDDTLHMREWTPRMERYRDVLSVAVRPVGPLSSFLATDPTKLMVAGPPADIAELDPRLRRRYGGSLNIAISLPFLLDIGSPRASKGQALAYLAEHDGFSSDEVIAFGDAEPDIDMLQWAGLGVAVGNAPARVKAAADAVCGPVGEDGVARFLLHLAGMRR